MAQKTTKKAPKKKAPKKKVAAKKVVKKQPTKKVAKKTVTRKTSVKKAVKKVTKKTATKKQATKKAAPKVIKKKTATRISKAATIGKASVSRSNAIGDDAKGAPTSFSLDEVQAVIAKRKSEQPKETKKAAKKKIVKTNNTAAKKKTANLKAAPEKKRVHVAASLTDILGFNPSQKKKTVSEEAASVPRKWKRYYKLLVELRQHLQDELDLHTSDTLMHCAREDAGDLSSYGNHQADAGTDTFDRDFALSLVSSEQDALYEIEEAIRRIMDGTYGVCEQTGEQIKKERLEAVPFARFSLEGQKEHEKTKNSRKNDRGIGEIFSDQSDAPKIITDDD